MGMGGCYAVLKYLVFLVNLIFWISGLTIIVISVWMLSDPAFYVSMAQETSDYYSGVYLLLVVGILMFIVGFLGCCGVIRESQCMLVLFFCFLLIILVAEISAAAWAYSNRNDLEELIKDNVAKTVLDEYSVIQSRTDTFDTFQQELKCCGAKRPTDWFNSKFNNAQKQQVSLAISSPTQGYEVPRSCCKDITNEVECDKIRKIGISAVVPDGIFSQGCNDLLIEKLEENVFGVVVFGVCVAFCQILGLICALVLCCGIQQRDRYKA